MRLAMLLADGEASNSFLSVNIFDSSKRTKTGSMNINKLGTGLADLYCSCGKIFISTGASTRYSLHESSDLRLVPEVYAPKNNDYFCSSL